MFFALMDYKGGIGGFVGLTIFQPIMGMIFSGLTIIACTIVGLPIRLHKPIRTWWVLKPYIPLLLFVLGIVLVIVAHLPSQMSWISRWEKDYEIRELVPNTYFIVVGWLAIGFSLLHFYPLGYILAKSKTS